MIELDGKKWGCGFEASYLALWRTFLTPPTRAGILWRLANYALRLDEAQPWLFSKRGMDMQMGRRMTGRIRWAFG